MIKLQQIFIFKHIFKTLYSIIILHHLYYNILFIFLLPLLYYYFIHSEHYFIQQLQFSVAITAIPYMKTTCQTFLLYKKIRIVLNIVKRHSISLSSMQSIVTMANDLKLLDRSQFTYLKRDDDRNLLLQYLFHCKIRQVWLYIVMTLEN